MRKFYLFFAGSVAFALCGRPLFAQNPIVNGQNTATGSYALASCTSCYSNVADGFTALNSLTQGLNNVAVGFEALYYNTTGYANTAVGWAALTSNTAINNTAIGNGTLYNNVTGSNNTAVGAYAFTNGNGGESYSTMVGVNAGMWTQSPVGYNTAIGYDALLGASGVGGGAGNTGYYNVAAGVSALYSNTTGSYNTVAGTYSENRNTTGSGNVTSGYISLYDNTTGGANTGIGMEALYSNSTGSDNTAVGAYANVSSGTLSNATALGASAMVTASNSVRIGSSSVTSIGGYANWTNFSDGRYKKNIQSNVPGLAFINKLNPVTYTLDIDGIEAQLQKGSSTVPSGSPSISNDPVMKQAMQDKSAVTYTGFVAQDVEKAADSLNFVFSGIDKPKDAEQSFYGLRYGDFVPPLVKAVQELSASSNSKDSVINAMQMAVNAMQMTNDSLRTQMVGLAAQMAELKAMVQAQKSAASLNQNVPNPFVGSTIIGYSIPQSASSAQMQISDVTGKVLAVIALSGKGPGTITADVSGYAAGIYNYSLIVDGRLVSTRKMVSVR